MSNYPLPADARLEQLIRESFDALPGPDSLRINRLEARLIRAVAGSPEKRPNTLPWWIVLLLAGGIATAAWWGGKLNNGHNRTITGSDEIIEKTMMEETGAVENPPEQGTGASPTEPLTETKSPVIYQRESF